MLGEIDSLMAQGTRRVQHLSLASFYHRDRVKPSPNLKNRSMASDPARRHKPQQQLFKLEQFALVGSVKVENHSGVHYGAIVVTT